LQISLFRLQGASTPLGKVRTQIFDIAQSQAAYIPTSVPHFLWVTEFPLFTRSDPDKDIHLAQGRWSSTHHPFTAPVWEDVDALWAGEADQVLNDLLGIDLILLIGI
jgi:aspartyl-tRNA synthetase